MPRQCQYCLNSYPRDKIKSHERKCFIEKYMNTAEQRVQPCTSRFLDPGFLFTTNNDIQQHTTISDSNILLSSQHSGNTRMNSVRQVSMATTSNNTQFQSAASATISVHDSNTNESLLHEQDDSYDLIDYNQGEYDYDGYNATNFIREIDDDNGAQNQLLPEDSPSPDEPQSVDTVRATRDTTDIIMDSDAQSLKYTIPTDQHRLTSTETMSLELLSIIQQFHLSDAVYNRMVTFSNQIITLAETQTDGRMYCYGFISVYNVVADYCLI
ncbi:hypothetical protein BDC45DRAFT_542538 [Circinella umbellata]|nr:hypothetical protein BDC45DRAFT_542538 [Circinella umbellata]